jgi:uncharacterized protein YkwD
MKNKLSIITAILFAVFLIAPLSSRANESYQCALQVLKIANKHRTEAGKHPLKIDPKICRLAEVRAKELVRKFSHSRPDGRSCFTILKANKIGGAQGENIAAGQRSPEAVMNSWMNSPGHRANIMSGSFRKLGVGMYKDKNGKRYWVQLFTS